MVNWRKKLGCCNSEMLGRARPRSQQVNESKVNELANMYIPNDRELYERRIMPTVKRYEELLRKGKFDKEKALKGIITLIIKPAITKYRKEVNQSLTLTQAEKEAAAREVWRVLYDHIVYDGYNAPREL